MLRKRREPTRAPGEWTAQSDDEPTDVRWVSYGGERKVKRGEGIPELCEPGVRYWFDVVGLGTQEVLQDIAGLLDLEALLVADIVNRPQRCRWDDYGNVQLIIAQMAVATDTALGFRREQVSVVLGEHFVATFQESRGDVFESIRKRLRKGSGRVRFKDSGYLAYLIIDAVIEGYFDVLRGLSDRLERLENAVVEGNAQSSDIIELHTVRRHLQSLRRPASEHYETLRHLSREEGAPLGSDNAYFVRDALDHAKGVLDGIEHALEASASILALHVAALGQQTNEIMKLVTLLGAVLLPVGVVAGIYGTNFASLPGADHPAGFWLMCGGMASVSGILMLVFWVRGWLR